MKIKPWGAGALKKPWFPLFAQDFTSDVQHMSAQEIGCLTLLMCYQWVNGSIPNNIQRVALICHISSDEMKQVWKILKPKFIKDKDGSFVNKRLALEKQSVESKSRKAKKAANIRWHKATPDNGSNAVASKTDNKNKEYRIKNKEGGLRTPPCPAQKIMGLYNEICAEQPRAKVMTSARQSHLKTRWKEHPDINWWRKYFTHVATVKFLTGENERNWSAGFDFLISESKMAKIMEGDYE